VNGSLLGYCDFSFLNNIGLPKDSFGETSMFSFPTCTVQQKASILSREEMNTVEGISSQNPYCEAPRFLDLGRSKQVFATCAPIHSYQQITKKRSRDTRGDR